MKIQVESNHNWTTDTDELNNQIKTDFYTAKDKIFAMGYDEYVELKSLPLSPSTQNIFYPLATWRVKDTQGQYNQISIYCMALGGVLITDEF